MYKLSESHLLHNFLCIHSLSFDLIFLNLTVFLSKMFYLPVSIRNGKIHVLSCANNDLCECDKYSFK